MPADRRVVIRHPRTGQEFAILPRDFRTRRLAVDKDGQPQSYADAGYQILRYEDGQPYQPPKTEG